MSHTVVWVLLSLGVLWHPVRPGVWQADMSMADEGPLSVVRAIVIRLDPAALRFDLVRRDEGLPGGWTIDRMPAEAVVAFNAGQFTGAWSWGWLVRDGVELQEPGTGTVSMSFVLDSTGRPSLVTPAELPAVRGQARLAFQSYPALLIDGEAPWELQAPGRGVDLQHRDARLAMCLLSDGSVVVAITRFTGLGRRGGTLPWGPTVGEMSAFMGWLGCERAMLLDGGISSQLALRAADGKVSRWANWRAVPLGLVVTPKRTPAWAQPGIGWKGRQDGVPFEAHHAIGNVLHDPCREAVVVAKIQLDGEHRHRRHVRPLGRIGAYLVEQRIPKRTELETRAVAMYELLGLPTKDFRPIAELRGVLDYLRFASDLFGLREKGPYKAQ